MKLTKIAAVVILAGTLSSFAQAATPAPTDSGHGSVTFTGSIISAACSIANDKQDVYLGEISNAALEADDNSGRSTPVNFTINLQNCDTGPGNSTVSTTFTGATDANDPDGARLGITGTASGAGIVLTDGAGKPIALGTATDPQGIQDGNNSLLFSAYLQGDGASATIVPGEFTAIADFTLAYN
ncbi:MULTISPECIES: fimbrial protein [unclassified Citrobacter]|uniref:fimbrial protein n=1 Tax=unclassified Citrobacter TaxID=2644389 RepID=UPI001CE484C8|nr:MULTISPECIES: fimbrial protein [unclassified Citrobacter]MDM2941465.1 type 1 fimbrial protein [Citrobacter sp. Cm038]